MGTLAVSQQQIDTQRALIKQQEAQIRSDEASIENLTAILGYTNVVAPIDGRTGIRLLDEGNLVRAGDQNGFVVITEIHPISVLFTLPQQTLPQLTRAFGKGPLTAEAYTTDGQSLLDKGTLQVVDNQVDPATGTVRLKAEFPNEKLQLWPGQFVNVRLLVDTLNNATVAPVAAVQHGPSGAFVYVVKDDETVELRNVKIAQQDDKEAVFTDGLKAGERVVTSGFGRLEQGTKIKVNDVPALTSEAASPSRPAEQGSLDAGEKEAQNSSSGPAATPANAEPTTEPAADKARSPNQRRRKETSK